MSSQNRIKVTKNAQTKRVTLVLERRNSWRLIERIQFTVSERAFSQALLDAQIIAPWNRVSA